MGCALSIENSSWSKTQINLAPFDFLNATFQIMFLASRLSSSWRECTFYSQQKTVGFFFKRFLTNQMFAVFYMAIWNAFLGCAAGYFGINCSEQCPYPKYGDRCRHHCDCGIDTCDKTNGCLSISTMGPGIYSRYLLTICSSRKFSFFYINICKYL